MDMYVLSNLSLLNNKIIYLHADSYSEALYIG